jgi:hypothetical protein
MMAIISISDQQERAAMAVDDQHQVETTTATEARQGERGPTILALLVVSTGLAVLILGVIWFVWFRV